MTDWLGWGDLSCNEQRYAIGVSGFALGGWFVMAMQTLFSSWGQRRKKRKRRR